MRIQIIVTEKALMERAEYIEEVFSLEVKVAEEVR